MNKKQADFACFNGLYMLLWDTTVIARPAKQAVAISVFDNLTPLESSDVAFFLIGVNTELY
jgi:hypothetical protein